MKALTLFVLSLALTGCISTEHSSDNTNPVAAVNADGLVCKREKPTGSHRSMKICRTVSEVENNRREAELMTRRVRRQSQIN